MSYIVSAAVLRKVVGSQTRKAIMLYMADRASDDGSGIWTSKGNIAAHLEMSTRTVQREIKALEDCGLISTVGIKPCRNGHTVDYRINLDAVSSLRGTPDTVSPLTGCHPYPRHSVTPTPDTVSPKPSFEPSIEPSFGETEKSPPKKTASRNCQLPEGWVPNERNIEDAIERNFTQGEIDHEAGQFRDHHLARGNNFKDWNAAWRTWLGNARKFSSRSNARGNSQPHDPRLIALRSAALPTERSDDIF